MRTLRSEWESYKKDVISKSAGAIQLEVSEESFYAGAIAVASMLGDMTDLPDEESDRCVAMLTAEIAEFIDRKTRRR